MALKQQGNEFFKSKRYQQAIQCYQQYIDHDPQADKKIAYCNISFCYYKMGQFHESAQAAQNSVQQDQTYHKAYYRKMQAFKEIQGEQYQVFVNFHLLLKYATNLAQKDKEDYQSQMKEWKARWMLKTFKSEPSIDWELLDIESQKQGKMEPEQKDLVENWVEEWARVQKEEGEHWLQIEQIAKKDLEYGINIAYLYLNFHQEDKKKCLMIKEKIETLKEALQKKESQMDVESKDSKDVVKIPGKKEEEKTTKKDQQDKKQSSINSTHKQKQSKTAPEQNVQNFVPEKTIEKTKQNKPTPVVEPTKQKKQEKKQEIVSPSQIVAQKSEVPSQAEKIQAKDEDITTLYKVYKQYLESSRDVMYDFLKQIQKILISNHTKDEKEQLFILLKKDFPKIIKLMKTSFSKKQQQKVHDLLVQNDLEQFLPDFASKHLQ